MQNILMALALAGDTSMQLNVHTEKDRETFNALEHYFKNNGKITDRHRYDAGTPAFETFRVRQDNCTVIVFGYLND